MKSQGVFKRFGRNNLWAEIKDERVSKLHGRNGYLI
jgi:hypothetical protein